MFQASGYDEGLQRWCNSFPRHSSHNVQYIFARTKSTKNDQQKNTFDQFLWASNKYIQISFQFLESTPSETIGNRSRKQCVVRLGSLFTTVATHQWLCQSFTGGQLAWTRWWSKPLTPGLKNNIVHINWWYKVVQSLIDQQCYLPGFCFFNSGWTTSPRIYLVWIVYLYA